MSRQENSTLRKASKTSNYYHACIFLNINFFSDMSGFNVGVNWRENHAAVLVALVHFRRRVQSPTDVFYAYCSSTGRNPTTSQHERTCAACLDCVKMLAFIPCSHVFCARYSERLNSRATCPTDVIQNIKIYL